MMTTRPRRGVMVLAMCLLSVPLAVWVMSRATTERRPRTAVGAARLPDVTPLPAAGPQDVPTAPAGALVPAVVNSPGGTGVPSPAAPHAAASAGSPLAEPARPPAVSPPRGSLAAALETHARGALRSLDGLEDGTSSPIGRVAALFTLLEPHQCAGGACQAAQRATEAYLRARAAILRAMLEAFLTSGGEDDGTREHQALRTLHADFTADMATLTAHVPMLARLPDILATTLPIPDFLALPEDAPGVQQADEGAPAATRRPRRGTSAAFGRPAIP